MRDSSYDNYFYVKSLLYIIFYLWSKLPWTIYLKGTEFFEFISYNINAK